MFQPTTFTVSPPTYGTSSKTFQDALKVRIYVFVDEQKIPLENEIDQDDERSWHWVVYDHSSSSPFPSSPTSTSDPIPVGTLRLVPPPHSDYPNPHGGGSNHGGSSSSSYIKFGRLATCASARGRGVGRMLIEAAAEFAKAHSQEINAVAEPEGGVKWDGRCFVHAQVVVRGLWEKLGFVVDEGVGEWDEEGIMHLGMWRDLES